jgi:hypothetical protein
VLQAKDLGCDAVLSVIPYYNKPTQVTDLRGSDPSRGGERRGEMGFGTVMGSGRSWSFSLARCILYMGNFFLPAKSIRIISPLIQTVQHMQGI